MEIKTILESAIISLNNNSSIENILLQAQTIACLLKDEELKKWIKCEQLGYTDDDNLPSYRKIECQVKVDISQPFGKIIQNFSFPPGLMDKYEDRLFHIPFHNSLIEIEKLSSSEGMLHSEIIAGVYPEMNRFINGNIINARQITSPQSLVSIITTVKAKLLEIFLDLNEKYSINLDLNTIEMSKSNQKKIMNQTIYAGVVNTGNGSIDINNSNVISGNENTVSISDDKKKELLELLQKIQSICVLDKNDKQDVDESISAIRDELENKKSDSGVIRRALKVLKSIPAVIASEGIGICLEKAIEAFATM